MNISSEDINAFEKRYRTNFVNSISGFKSLFLISTLSDNGVSNLAIFNSVKHIGANPPLLGFISRPDSVERHTIENIRSRGEYGLNAVCEEIFRQAHQTAARYNGEVSEFEATELETEFMEGSNIPFVKSSPIKIHLKLEEEIAIKTNGTHLVIGSIRQIVIDEKAIQSDGFINLEILNIITGSGLDAYHKTELIERLPYAKVKS